MIKNIISSSQHVRASSSSSLPYVYSNNSNPWQGTLRINGNDIEAYDGNSWIRVYMGDGHVSLSGDAEEAINWAIKRMAQEKEWNDLASSNEAVRIALEQLQEARARLELTAHLARDHEKETTS